MPKTLQNLDSETRRYLAVSTGQILGIFVPALIPLLTGYGIDSRGLTFSEVGSIWTITFLSRGMGALAATVIILKLPKRPLLLNCVITSCIIHSLGPLIPNELIEFVSFPAGFVDGIILATAISAIAESKNPTRLCGKVMVTAGLLLAIIATVFPFVVPLFGNKPGLFAGFVFLCGLPIVSLLPPPETKAPETNEVKIDAGSKGPFLNRIFIICVLLGFAIDATSRQMLWGLVERRGLVVGFDVQQVGLILGGTAILGLLGAVFASTIGLRFGRSIPIVVGLVVTTSGMMLILYLSTKPSFIASRCAWTFGETFYGPFYVGIIAALDPKGRLNSLSVALGALGESLGPSLSGFIIEFTGYARDVSILACILQLSIIALVLPVALKFDRSDHKLTAVTS